MQIEKQVKAVGFWAPAYAFKAIASQLTLEQLKEMSSFIGVENASERAVLEFKCASLGDGIPRLDTKLRGRTLSLNLTKLAKRPQLLTAGHSAGICTSGSKYAYQDWAQALRQSIHAATVMENAANVLQRTLANWGVAEVA